MFPSTVNSLAYPRKRVRQPRHVRASSPNSVRSAVPASVGVGGVQLDLGRPGGAGLRNQGGNWGWEWVGRDDPYVRIAMGEEGLCLFPGERELDSLQTTELSVKENIAAVSNYLEDRLELYDHLGVKDLIAQEMEDHFNSNTRSIRVSQSMPNLSDPSEGLLEGHVDAGNQSTSASINVYDGTKLAVVVNNKARLVKAIACFPTGPLGSELNISPFLPMSNTHVTNGLITRFVPSSTPVRVFPTPILQLASSSAVSPHRLDRESTALVVRLQSSTHLLHLVPIPTYIPPSDSAPVTLDDIATLRPSDTAGRHHVDIALDPTSFGRALIVDECGGVWLWTESKVEVAERLSHSAHLRRIRQAVTTTRDSFFRVAWGTRPGTAVVMSRTELVLLDLEGDSPPETLLELHGDGRMFTSLDKTALERQASYSTLTTTYEVIWVDELAPGSPVLSWTHDYGGGNVKDLEVAVVHIGEQAIAILSSGTENTFLAVHGPSEPPATSQHHPYALTVPQGLPLPLASLGVVHTQPNDVAANTTMLLGITPEGALWTIPLRSSREQQQKAPKRKAAIRTKWSDAVQAKAERKEPPVMEDDDDDIAGTRFKDLNLRWAWLEINEGPASDELFSLDELDKYMRELDAPLEHLMTAGEIARDMLYGQTTDTRSNLLRSMKVDPDLPLTGLASADMSRHIPLIWQLGSADCQLGSVFPATKSLSRIEQANRHIADVNNLTLDLALARSVLNSESISPPSSLELSATQTSATDSPEDVFARVAGQLSLDDKQPAPISFSYLFPRLSDTDSAASQPNTIIDPLQSLPARMLMEEWPVGSDPKAYDWTPWDGTAPSAAPSAIPASTPQRARAIRPLPNPRSPARTTFSQPQPPALRATASVPTLFRVPPNVVRSSPPPESMPSSSFDMSGFVQTQGEPGKFGARAAVGKKKVKKRVGGF